MIVKLTENARGHLLRICLDTEAIFFLDRDFAAQKGIKPGYSLTEDDVRALLEESDFIRAKQRGLWFLDRADRSEKVLFDKIRAAGISPEACAKAIARFKELGLLDDRRYAARLAQGYAENNISRKESYYKMLQKGVPKDIIMQVLDNTCADETAQICAIIDKKYRNRITEAQDISKTVAALMRKGFSYGKIREALKIKQTEIEFQEDY